MSLLLLFPGTVSAPSSPVVGGSGFSNFTGTYDFSLLLPKLDAGSDDPRAIRQHAAEIARSLRQFSNLASAVNALSARLTALDAGAIGLELENGTYLLLEDGTEIFLEGTPLPPPPALLESTLDILLEDGTLMLLEA